MKAVYLVLGLISASAAHAKLEMQTVRTTRSMTRTDTYDLDEERLAMSFPVGNGVVVEMMIYDEGDEGVRVQLAAVGPDGDAVASEEVTATWGQEVRFGLGSDDPEHSFAFTVVRK